MPGKTGSASLLRARSACPARDHLAESWLQLASGQFSSCLDVLHETNALAGGI